ncbi:metalloregulator ArsR/SmtB family transcription factor [Nesterenkonia sp. LB17]|uniref:ArsR/SmtB family transcription factor n=1 Tax=unclassified Nesterenkonia TaxID=2629769 RepID=UPI001F4C865F|nr:metalloregulator ArsR/SmtB family transcription factor [Nesterenkonia sp. DZ6]MCH8565124.1 metalloregulator ArsR/SmtB family transcription factor [Nesterenkonia sp. LB17]MCH8571480.1 metalloregulator ArsR/SmtB family transcription factor [Nesterenkonia sp. AY15]
MRDNPAVISAAQLFKVLGHESRLWLLCLIGESPKTVNELVALTAMSQPLVSQHLRTLKQAGLVLADRHGREIEHRLADEHVSHVIADAIAHAQEPVPQRSAAESAAKEHHHD